MATNRMIQIMANEDIDEIIKMLHRAHPELNIQRGEGEFDTELTDDVNYEYSASTYATYPITADGVEYDFTIEYFQGDDDVYYAAPEGIKGLAKDLEMKITHEGKISAANVTRKARIVGADEDFDAGFDDAGFDEGPDDIEDTLDGMADDIEDIQDSVDEIQEDDVNIDIENNIEDHYIAECDRCHGIFISAMVESDQIVDHISGVCPLCEKESDQYLYWIVKRVEK